MPPSDERLEPLDDPVGETHDRLIVKTELATLHGAAQVVFQTMRLDQSSPHGRLKDETPGASRCLRQMHRRVGIAKACFWSPIDSRTECDSHTQTGEELPPVQPKWRSKRLLDSPGFDHRLVGIGARVHHDRKFVATEVGQAVSWADDLRQSVPHREQ